MRVLTLLPLAMRATVDRVMRPKFHTAQHSRSVVELLRALQSDLWGAIVVDPAVLTDDSFDDLRSAMAESRIGVLLWGSFTPACERFLMASVEGLVVDVVFSDREVDPSLLGVKLDSIQERTACGRLLRAIAPWMHPMPRAVRGGIVRMFGALPVLPSAKDLASSIGVPRRTLDRWVIRRGFVSTAAMMNAIRLAWAWDLSRIDSGEPPASVLSRCGYPSPHRFWEHTHRVLSIAPSVLRATPPSDATVQLLVDSIRR